MKRSGKTGQRLVAIFVLGCVLLNYPLVKLLAFLAVGVFVTLGTYRGFGDLFSLAHETPRLRALLTVPATPQSYGTWVFLTILSMLSFMLLPRQFQAAQTAG
jgi:hypothetical protein